MLFKKNDIESKWMMKKQQVQTISFYDALPLLTYPLVFYIVKVKENKQIIENCVGVVTTDSRTICGCFLPLEMECRSAVLDICSGPKGCESTMHH